MENKEFFNGLQKEVGFNIQEIDDDINFDSDRFIELPTDDDSSKYLSKFFGELPQLKVASDMATKTLYRIEFPEGVSKNLMKLKRGGYATPIVNNGRIVDSASLHPVQIQAGVMGAMSIMSIVSGQYYLNEINKELKTISLGIDNILKFLYGDKKAELIGELNFIKYAYKNYSSMMECEEQRVATIATIQQSKKIAMKDIDFYLKDLEESVDNKKADPDKAFQIKSCLELSIQLYIMSNVLEVYYSQNYNDRYIKYLEDETLEYISKLETKILSEFSRLKGKMEIPNKGLLNKDKNKSTFKPEVDKLTKYLVDGEELVSKKLFSNTMSALNKTKEFYLANDGKIYLKKA